MAAVVSVAAVPRLARWMAIALALAVCGVGLVRGTWAAGGSDSSCYALMADAFARGDLQPVTPLAREAPWPDASRTFAPAGFIPSPIRDGAASPICAPGFSLLLAPLRLVGGPDGIFVATPIAGAMTVWLAWWVATRLAGPWAGIAAALVAATIPVFLFQVVQPMNDVTSAALSMGIMAAALTCDPTRPWLLGFLTGLMVLVRPNLAPVAVVVGVWVMVMSVRAGGVSNGLLRRNVCAFVLAGLPSAIILAALNTMLYGALLQSGYGRAADLFALANVVPNAAHYGRALLETQLGLPLLGVFAPLILPRPHRAIGWLAVAVSLSVLGVYLLYRPFDEWWYLRFLLPALVPLTVLAIAALSRACRLLPLGPAARTLVGGIVVIGLALYGVRTARERQAFDLHRLEHRFRLAAEIAGTRLPADAVFLSIWESGSLRHHAGRTALLWDSRARRARRGCRVASRPRPRPLHRRGTVGGAAVPAALREPFRAGRARLAATLRDRATGAHLQTVRSSGVSEGRASAHGVRHPEVGHPQITPIAQIQDLPVNGVTA